ncbi:MAG: D-alanyl-D-alanine carboxypeptidase [Lachnospiraceae bacterium]|nr:D-alanyl-D-alanine carboxypeptidase [Lachnospiraceae bacterium]
MGNMRISVLGTILASACVVGSCFLMQKYERIPSADIEQVTTREGNQDASKIVVNNPDEYFKYTYYEPIEYKETSAVVESDGSDITAKSAILVDADSNEILYEKDCNKKMAPASTTKLATAITAVNIIDMDEKITVGDEIGMIGAGSSTAGLGKGETLTFKELLQGLLLSSGNDAAYVIARYAGKKIYDDDITYDGMTFTSKEYVQRFVEEMNKNVRDMGLDNTHFMSPDGYDVTGQYTSASDLSKIALQAINNADIKEICGTASVSTSGHTWTTTNELMHKESSYYYEYAIGMKTGSTDAAGKCLVSAAQKDGRTCISVVLNSTTEGRYEDSLKLLRKFE